MNREKLIDTVKSAYQKGYREGFADACSLVRNTVADLAESMAESLEKHTIIVDEHGAEEE